MSPLHTSRPLNTETGYSTVCVVTSSWAGQPMTHSFSGSSKRFSSLSLSHSIHASFGTHPAYVLQISYSQSSLICDSAKQCCLLLYCSCLCKLFLSYSNCFSIVKCMELLDIFLRNVFCFIHMHKTRQPFINPVINRLLVDTTTLYMVLYPTSCQFKPKEPAIWGFKILF
jgi:hypothetical protein